MLFKGNSSFRGVDYRRPDVGIIYVSNKVLFRKTICELDHLLFSQSFGFLVRSYSLGCGSSDVLDS